MLKKKVLIFVSTLIFFNLIAISTQVYALSCFGDRPEITLEEFINKSEVIFLGKALSTETVKNQANNASLVNFEILKSYKGIASLTKNISVLNPISLGGFNRTPKVGQEVLIGAISKNGNLVRISFPECSKWGFSIDEINAYKFKNHNFITKNLLYVGILIFISASIAALYFISKKHQRSV